MREITKTNHSQLISEQPFRGNLFNTEQLIQHAAELAVQQQIVGGVRNDFLPERLNHNDKILRDFNTAALLSIKSNYVTPATEWMVDNFYLIEEHVQLARRHFPKQYNRALPSLTKGTYKGLPRVYGLVIELLSHVDSQIDEESLKAFIRAYQTQSVLKIGELWAVPIMLRLALIENLQRIATSLKRDQRHRDVANKWMTELETMVVKKPSQLVEIVSDMAQSNIPLTSAFVSELCQRLSSQNSSLELVRNWLEQRLAEEGLSIEELVHAESQNQAANQLTVSHSIQSLRFLNDADWKMFVEDLSIVELMLHEDPSEVYPRMDFATRDHYRHVIETLARKSLYSETEIAQQAIRLASKAYGEDMDIRHTHVGYYLVSEGLSALTKALGIKRTFKSVCKQFAERFPLTIYLGSITLLTLIGTTAFIYIVRTVDVPITDWRLIILSLFFLISTSQLAVYIVNWVSTLSVKPDMLPRLNLSKGITPDYRTMVVIPTMISNKAGVEKLIASLELHYLSNRDPYLQFGLLTDFVDSKHETHESDAPLLEQTKSGIERLNRKYSADDNSLFYLFHRPRRWNPKENTWMGYERKRGKLAEFNTLLRGGSAECFSLIIGDSSLLGSIKYVITLDTDTQLPPDTAHKLVGAMAHPLNRPEFDPKRNVVVRGYGIIQPRVASTMSSSHSSQFSRMFTDDAGIDPYTRMVSDVYQDIFHEGSFIGKGIYDVDAFEQALGGRFPDNKILSHDLLESTYVRSALVSDIQIYESYPSGYHMDAKRRYRWIRGDWQILQWLLPRVPTMTKKSERNPISGLGRWKIFDNLRRSLVAPATLLFLIGFSALLSTQIWLGVLLVLALIVAPIFFAGLTDTLYKSKEQKLSQHLRKANRNIMYHTKQILFILVMLPYDAFMSSDAILRTLWRLIVSRKNLLEWQASVDADRAASDSLTAFYRRMWFSPVFALSCVISLGIYNPRLLYVLPLLLIWFLAPFMAWQSSRPSKQKTYKMTEEQDQLIHRIARKTWNFFEVFVNARENWLPPDNFQEEPIPIIAGRTSPTNIGLSLLANLSAYDMGYLPAGRVLERTGRALSTMTAMQKYRGHLYNWYDTRTLEPLLPMYVSSVDSGNLAAHLLTLAQGIRGIADKPIYDPVIFEGLLDTVRVMRSEDKKNHALKLLESSLLTPLPKTINEAFKLLTSFRSHILIANTTLSHENILLQTWGATLLSNCTDYLEELLHVAPWAGTSFDVENVPTLREIANLDDPSEIMKKASENARQRVSLLKTLAQQSENFAKMDFGFLYNPTKKLFAIGYNASEQRMDASSYDMLASEARLCSYVAIAQGQIPMEHWFSLSRLLILPQGKPVLLSWSGSMFEYLMPLLVMPNFEDTLLDMTYRGVVHEQIEYSKKFNVPWGISESGHNRTDAYFNYQYKAFGIPSLGLKRGLSEDLVIAPYASVMALMVAPRKAAENMQRLSTAAHEGNFGYYEAIDYTPVHLPPKETSVDVRSFMAHHQGMSLVALGNLINGNTMQQRFMSCPMLKAFELLLQERIPQSISANILTDDSKFEIEGIHTLLSESSNMNRVFDQSDISPEVNLLTNGRYQVMVSNTGAGYSRWNNLAVTRWREDATCDNWGMFVYLRDLDNDDIWSLGHQPIQKKTKGYEAKFTQAYADFKQQHSGLNINTTICVSPEDDIELRRVTITNYSGKLRRIEFTTYSEVVIAPQADDQAHPAFSNLFVQTEFNPSASALFCARRARSAEEQPPHLLHMMLVQQDYKNDISCETDRSRFVGRNRSLSNPLAMQTAGALSGSEGSVLDPIIALRRTVIIPAGEKVEICIALGMSETKVGAMTMADKYQNMRMTERAFELAWTHSQVVLYQLNITEAEAQLFAKLSSALVYMNPAYRADHSILKNNRRGQSGLWGYSISGDMPLVLLRVSDMEGVELVRQMVLAHAYWRMKGLTVELVILNEDSSVYRQPLHDEIVSLISRGVEAPLLERVGGIFVRSIEQMPREDILLLETTARIVLTDKQGTLLDQLAKVILPELSIPLFKPTQNIVSHNERPLSKRELLFDNGLGGFTSAGDEYVITLRDGQTTPAPWCNVLANRNFGTVVSESGGAYTWAQNAHEFRLTPWNNDPIRDTSGEAFYIRDEQTGQFWSPTPWPAKGRTPYVIRHGFGYSVFEHSENGIYSELWVYVALDESVKFSVLKLHNTSNMPRKISVTGYSELILADQKSKSMLQVQTQVDVETGVLFARNFYNIDFSGQIAFIDVGQTRTVTGDRREFIGQNGNLANPAAMRRKRISGKTGAGMDSCGAVQVVFDMAEDEVRETRFRLGYAYNKREMLQLVAKYRKVGATAQALEDVRAYWKRTLSTVCVDTPDQSVNVMSNGWLLYQTLSSRIWARSGYYQSGGAYGFRDQLQDVMAMVHAEPAITRDQILRAARHQFPQGDVQHWWHPPMNRGVRTHFSDDYLWLPYVTARYIDSVADTGILDERVQFIEGRELRADEESFYDLPIRTEESATLYEHCVRSIEYGLKFGVHGLPLMGGGDWNDGMNLVGKDGRGESVWLAFFLYDVLIKFVKIAKLQGDVAYAKYCEEQAQKLKKNIKLHAWDGEWYRRAYFDDGTPLGSAQNDECRIDSIPQSWSVISGGGNKEHSAIAMAQVDAQLVDRDAKYIRLFTPSFDKGTLNPGYIKGYIPGVRENGGQYTHAAIWTAQAFATIGETDKAWELFDLLNPVQHGTTPEQIAVYKVEPYVVAADVYGAVQHLGRGGWTWYTGSASWMYCLLVETLLGVKRSGNNLILSPSLKREWDTYTVHYRFYETTYHVSINRIKDSSQPRLIVDGEPQKSLSTIEMNNDYTEHFAHMWVK